MPLPRLIVTGASGFIGRHLLDVLKEDYRIYGIGRRSQERARVPIHPNIAWYQVDIGDRSHLESVFREIAGDGGADICIHLAAHYDFTGERHPEYHRTNVEGLRNVLDLCRPLRLRRFIFSSSVAACAFPRPGAALTEDSPADGDHIYAETKRIGEEMLEEYRDSFPSVIVRFAALFSDWCEYPPLFMFFGTWLGTSWSRNILAGRGNSAIPYLHVRDAMAFFTALLDRLDQLEPGEVVIASTDGSVTHRQLHETATTYVGRPPRRLIFMPRLLCRLGIHARLLTGRIAGELPFERPWMADYIDLELNVDASRTRRRLGWAPRERLEILRRLPFLLNNMRLDPVEWNRRNRAAMRYVPIRPNVKIHWLLEKHQQEIIEAFNRILLGPDGPVRFPSYQNVALDKQRWNHRVILHQLMMAVRIRDPLIFQSYCRDLAAERFQQGFDGAEVTRALEELDGLCLRILAADPESESVRANLPDCITLTIRYGCDQIQDAFEVHSQRVRRRQGENVGAGSAGAANPGSHQ